MQCVDSITIPFDMATPGSIVRSDTCHFIPNSQLNSVAAQTPVAGIGTITKAIRPIEPYFAIRGIPLPLIFSIY